MDNESLLELLNEDRQRQFWIKPWGDPDRPADQREDFDNPNIRVLFAKQPIGVEIGDILFVHRIKAAKLTCVTQVTTSFGPLTEQEILKEPNLARWPWRVDSKNLTPKLGFWWRESSLKTFGLAAEYNDIANGERVNLGSILHGNDKLKISPSFAKFLIGAIIAIES